MYDIKKLGANIRCLRKAHGETQEELGVAIAVEKNTISNYENGKREPDKNTLTAIASHFMTTVEELMHHDFAGIKPLRFDNKVLLKKLDIVLPIISNEEALKNESFSKAIALHQKFYECFRKEQLDDLELLTECFNFYEEAEKDERCWLACASNSVALCYLFLLILKIPAILSKAPAALLQIAKRDAEARKVLENPDINFEKEASQALSDFFSDDEIQDEMSKYICALKKSVQWCDLADYYLALQYAWGIVDNDLTFEFNCRIGIEMLDTLVSVKNKYAIDFMLMGFEAAGLKSSQTVDDKP